MTLLALIMMVLSSLLQVYMILLIIRIFLSWIQVDRSNPAINLLCNVTDPYLNWFRRFKWLTIARIDFSPVFAILLVNFLMSITNSIRMYGEITLSSSLGIIAGLLWSAISFFLSFFAVLCLVRLVSLWFAIGASPLWSILDSILQPLLVRVTRVFVRDRIVNYRTGLVVLGAVCGALWLVGSVGFYFLQVWIGHLPL